MKFLKFLFSGILTYAVSVGLTYVLIERVGLERYQAYALSLLLITLINFSLALCFTFQKKCTFALIVRYGIVLIAFSLFNYCIVHIFQIYFTGNTYYVLIFGVTTFIFFIKFKVYDSFVFK